MRASESIHLTPAGSEGTGGLGGRVGGGGETATLKLRIRESIFSGCREYLSPGCRLRHVGEGRERGGLAAIAWQSFRKLCQTT